jgi:hypothetical protein
MSFLPQPVYPVPLRGDMPTTTRIDRLGYVLGWTGNALAALILLITAYLAVSAIDTDNKIFVAICGIFLAEAFFGIGRALHYLLVG